MTSQLTHDFELSDKSLEMSLRSENGVELLDGYLLTRSLVNGFEDISIGA